jgi:hypothetical protein
VNVGGRKGQQKVQLREIKNSNKSEPLYNTAYSFNPIMLNAY